MAEVLSNGNRESVKEFDDVRIIEQEELDRLRKERKLADSSVNLDRIIQARDEGRPVSRILLGRSPLILGTTECAAIKFIRLRYNEQLFRFGLEDMDHVIIIAKEPDEKKPE